MDTYVIPQNVRDEIWKTLVYCKKKRPDEESLRYLSEFDGISETDSLAIKVFKLNRQITYCILLLDKEMTNCILADVTLQEVLEAAKEV